MRDPCDRPCRGRAWTRIRAFVLSCLVPGVLFACSTTPSHRYPGPGTPPPIAWVDTLAINRPAEFAGGDDFGGFLRGWFIEEPGGDLSLQRAVSGISPALNVTAFDDVVSSSWYTPRINRGGLTPESAAQGPPLAPPDTTAPLVVVAGKVDGVTPGFTVEDARGARFLVKFDPPGLPALASGADVVSSRIFWAAGYNVPLDVVIHFRPSDLVLAEDARVTTASGERPMTPRDIEAALDWAEPREDGTYRALASRFLEGSPMGPFRFSGRRPDDPNDYYPHEDRRELRGMWVLAAWLNHVDLRIQNTLDMYVKPTGYLKHHLIDFATTLGSGSIRTLNPREGMEYAVDVNAMVLRLATLGLYRVGWEGRDPEPLHPSLGWISTDLFDPGGWEPFHPAESLRRLTDRDGYWGAKLVAAFTGDHLRAIIARAAYPDDAADILQEVLLHRRRAVLRHWFGRVSPLEEVTAGTEGDTLVLRFRDLGVREALRTPSSTRYRWRIAGASGVGEATWEDAGQATLPIRLPPEAWDALRQGTPPAPVLAEVSVLDRQDGARRSVHIRLAWRRGAPTVTGLIH